VIKVRQLFLRPATWLTSTLLETAVGSNDAWACALDPRDGLWPVLLVVMLKEGPCPSSGDINRLMMMMMIYYIGKLHKLGGTVRKSVTYIPPHTESNSIWG
jgi:hypothetical protein